MAVKSGEVIEAGTSPTFGKYLVYESKEGYRIKYAHLSEILVAEGDDVEKSQVVAKSGNTGLSTGAHLHYGVSYSGEYIDPFNYLSLPYTQEVVEEYNARGETVLQTALQAGS